jgi:F-type H+-transporting ATPase subunit delta
MRGISAEGLATSSERVETLAAGGDAGLLGSELFAVADLLGREAGLRRALTDPAAGAEAKTQLTRAVLAGRLSDDTIEAVATAAASRWSSASDFVDTIELLGAIALVIDAEKQGQLSELEDELFRFGRFMLGSPELRDAITNRQVPVEHRQALVRSLLEGKASSSTISLAVHAVSSRHRSVEAALQDYEKLAAERQSRVVAVVRSAIELTDEQRDRLGVALAAQYGRQMAMNVAVDPEVLGGIRIEVGDDVIDGTILSRLDEARRRMAE